jgi:hypothetical protein
MAAQDGRVALAFDGFEARPPDMRQDMPLPACLQKNFLATI